MKEYEDREIFITGGAGFVGCNLAKHFLDKGAKVTIFDNLSRKGVEKNLEWLKAIENKKFRFVKGDIRDFNFLVEVLKEIKPEIILHCCAQTAVTTSIKNPREDFEINLLGTLNVLEAARVSETKPLVIFFSTNKVYGDNVNKLQIIEKESRYEFKDKKYKLGIPEDFPTDANAHTPYGCSKYGAELYVRDYHNVYNLQTVALRCSCIYGTNQFGNEDQGWLAHFVIFSIFGRPLKIYGNGKQVRDVLYVSDLSELVKLLIKNREKIGGEVFNVGGGPKNTVSLIEVINFLEEKINKKINYTFLDWRPSDQKVYISDIRKAERILKWKPKISPREGIEKLINWVTQNKELFI